MSDDSLLLDRLRLILAALERIPRRFAKIETPGDFVSSQSGVDLMDSICMVLLAAGEELKKIDNETGGVFFAQYPQIKWRGAIVCATCWHTAIFKSTRNSFTRSVKKMCRR